jgi:sulfatase maturation enzyme AslB (radical SAM superfamily)
MSETTDRPARMHDFVRKLTGNRLRPAVVDYVRWRQEVRRALAAGEAAPEPARGGPLSINLDLTTACNYACDHCIDWDALNLAVKHEPSELEATLRELAARGLQSVILIGGGEPTLHPDFGNAASRSMKSARARRRSRRPTRRCSWVIPSSSPGAVRGAIRCR